MKKMLSLILTLMLLAMCPAMAETAEETAAQTQTLVSPDGSYSFEVPADYFPMNAETMMNVLKTEEMQQFMAQMLGLEDASQLATYFAMVEASNLMVVYSRNLTGNINVQAIPTTLTMDQIVLMKEAMDAGMIQQYVSMGAAEADIQTMDIQEINGRNWYGIKLAMIGMPIMVTVTVDNGIQYVFGFTDIDEQEAMDILASFKVTAAAE